MSRYLCLIVVATLAVGWSDQRTANADDTVIVQPPVQINGDATLRVQAKPATEVRVYNGYSGYGGGYYGHAGHHHGPYHPWGSGYSRPYYGGNYTYGPAFYGQYGYYYPGGVGNGNAFPYAGYYPYSYGYRYPAYVP